MSYLAALIGLIALAWAWQRVLVMRDMISALLAPWVALFSGVAWCYTSYKKLRKAVKAWMRKPTFGVSRLATWQDWKDKTGIPLGKIGKNLVRMHHESCGGSWGYIPVSYQSCTMHWETCKRLLRLQMKAVCQRMK